MDEGREKISPLERDTKRDFSVTRFTKSVTSGPRGMSRSIQEKIR